MSNLDVNSPLKIISVKWCLSIQI